MSWHPNDLVTDTDLIAYERTILQQFKAAEWVSRRQKALEDWLFPLLEARGFLPHLLRTRLIATHVLGVTSSVVTDVTALAQTQDGLNLATILAASGDILYIGHKEPFRGLSVRVHEAVNTVASTPTLALWTDEWTTPDDLVDATSRAGKPFAVGGAITWRLPEALVKRTISTHGPAYWAKVSLSAAPTGSQIGPISVIRRSRLCACVTLRTLALIFREAPIGQDGPWREKAEYYEREASDAWLRVADQIGGEFDTDGDDVISPDENDQTAAEVSGGGWRLERY